MGFAIEEAEYSWKKEERICKAPSRVEMRVQISVHDAQTGRTETMDHNSHGLVGELENAVRKSLRIRDDEPLSLYVNECALDSDREGMFTLYSGSVLRVGRTTGSANLDGLRNEVEQRALSFGKGIHEQDQNMNLVRGSDIFMFE